ncbi:MAG: DUF4339 domain-containing protein [bacterium]|nr:DUF4339 domain-containing protein [bacterium]
MNDEDVIFLVIQFAVAAVFGIVCAAMAPGRGRSAVGWFFIGFLGGCLGIIILLLIPDLKKEAAKEKRQREETRKLREQLKKERQVADARHQAHGQRLGAHDRALGLDTTAAELPGDAAAPPPLPEEAESVAAANAMEWYYAVDGKQEGPVTAARLRDMWLDELVPDSALVWCEGMSDWRPIGELGDSLGGAQ